MFVATDSPRRPSTVPFLFGALLFLVLSGKGSGCATCLKSLAARGVHRPKTVSILWGIDKNYYSHINLNKPVDDVRYRPVSLQHATLLCPKKNTALKATSNTDGSSNPTSENSYDARDRDSGDDPADEDIIEEDENQDPASASMVFAIGLYKNYISPLLPPACRFLPTCSQYGVQAIEQFGPTKGFILTVWRLLRCTPFGGKGYDPPRWPPVKYTEGSY